MKVVLAKARVLGCTKYHANGNGNIYLLDDDQHLVAFARPGYKLWTASRREHVINADDVGNLANLRKRYEHKRNSGTSEGED